MEKIVLSAAVAVGLVLASSASAVTITNASFEDDAAPANSFATTTSLTGWSIVGSVDLIDDGFWQASDGNQSIDLSSTSAATISQTISGFSASQEYSLEFDMAANIAGGSTDKMLSMSIGTSVDNIFTFSPPAGTSYVGMNWETKTFDFIADSSDMLLSFTSLESNPYGPALDNIRITEKNDNGSGPPPGVIPLPASFPLLLAALGGLYGLRRRLI